jgi:hypothetical protein
MHTQVIDLRHSRWRYLPLTRTRDKLLTCSFATAWHSRPHRRADATVGGTSARADGGKEEYCRAAFAPRRPRAPAARVGLPPVIVPDLRSEASYIVTPVAPTGNHEGTSCPQMVFIESGGTSASGIRATVSGDRDASRPQLPGSAFTCRWRCLRRSLPQAEYAIEVEVDPRAEATADPLKDGLQPRCVLS